MRLLIGGFLVLMGIGCSSGSEDESRAPLGGAGAGSKNDTPRCGTAEPTLLYSTPNLIQNGVAADDQFVYFAEMDDDGTYVKKIPKSGGNPSRLARIPLSLDLEFRLYLDGDTLYYSTIKALEALDTAGGEPTVLAETATEFPIDGIAPQLAFDGDTIYFTDRATNFDGASLGTVNSVNKNGGEPQVLVAGQAAPVGVTFDAQNLYWINAGTWNNKERELVHNGGIASAPRAGGTATELFKEVGDGTGVLPYEGSNLLALDEKLLFASSSVVDVSVNALFSLPKTGGTPTKFTSCPAYHTLLSNGSIYANCGDKIARIDPATGVSTSLVCVDHGVEFTYGIARDAVKIYYVKLEADRSWSLYSIPLE